MTVRLQSLTQSQIKMNKYILLLAVFFTALLSSCGDDEPQNGIFSFEVTEKPAETEISINDTEFGISTNGEAQTIVVTLLGDYDNFRVTSSIPDWIYTTSSESVLKFKLNKFSGDEFEMRSAEITIAVNKGNFSVKGRIIIHQYALTYEDMKKTERRAIDSFLNGVTVIDKLPSITDAQVGSDAPYYKLDADGNIYMQIVSLGDAPAAKGETVFFRFQRYNLLSFYNTGSLGNGSGNGMSATSFVVGNTAQSTLQWGKAIPLPIELGLPLGSEVYLVVASECGIADEVANVTPFLYNIRYFGANI